MQGLRADYDSYEAKYPNGMPSRMLGGPKGRRRVNEIYAPWSSCHDTDVKPGGKYANHSGFGEMIFAPRAVTRRFKSDGKTLVAVASVSDGRKLLHTLPGT
jgi:hypothetical protein